jgi:hypothetical protein
MRHFSLHCRYIEMSTRIRYFQKRVIYNDLKFPDNYSNYVASNDVSVS